MPASPRHAGPRRQSRHTPWRRPPGKVGLTKPELPSAFLERDTGRSLAKPCGSAKASLRYVHASGTRVLRTEPRSDPTEAERRASLHGVKRAAGNWRAPRTPTLSMCRVRGGGWRPRQQEAPVCGAVEGGRVTRREQPRVRQSQPAGTSLLFWLQAVISVKASPMPVFRGGQCDQ